MHLINHPKALIISSNPSYINNQVAGVITAPIDTVKTRLQTSLHYTSALHCVQSTAKEGLATFWQGAAARVWWIGPNMMLTLTLYDRLSAQLRRYNNDK